MDKILVHNNWDPLEEIWLGDVWPEHFYDDLDSELQDSFCQITEWTKQDLNNIQKKLEEFNVIVRRPDVNGDKNKFIDNNTGKLLKPPICPRDNNAVIGNNLYFGDNTIYDCYKEILDLYPVENIIHNPLSGANIVKLGKDIIIDNLPDPYTSEIILRDFENFENKHQLLLDNYRIHYFTNGGHTDGCFMPLKEGLLLTTRYWDNYNTTFPGWKKIELRDPTYSGTKWGNPNGQRWLLPNLNVPPQLNQYLEDYCKDWIGNYTETYFEVNVLMIDEKNMLCMGTHDEVFRDLEKEGINCHVIPFRTRGFWDGGLHCITLDIRRQAVMKDYFFCRGNVGLKTFTDKVFPDVNIFLKKYNAWKNKKEK